MMSELIVIKFESLDLQNAISHFKVNQAFYHGIESKFPVTSQTSQVILMVFLYSNQSY